MTKYPLIAIAALFASFTAHAADPTAVNAKPTLAAQTVQATPTAAPAAAPQKTAAISQQEKMRQCSKQATGKKGAERKTFMKTCLSKKT